MIKVITLLIILIILPISTSAMNLDPPNDKYWHAGFGATCNLIWVGIFSAGDSDSGQLVTQYPKLSAFILCNSIGLLKEFAWDDRPDWQDVAANNVGIGGSMVILKW